MSRKVKSATYNYSWLEQYVLRFKMIGICILNHVISFDTYKYFFTNFLYLMLKTNSKIHLRDYYQ